MLETLLAAAAAAGVTVGVVDERCSGHATLLGGWDPQAEQVFLCRDNIRAEGRSEEEILRHELIHVIQDRVGQPLLPEPLLTLLSRDTLPSGEALLVITTSEDRDREFECRVLTRLLSSEAVAHWLMEASGVSAALGHAPLAQQGWPD